MKRRTLLATVAGATVLAGCLSDGDGDDSRNDAGDNLVRLVEDETFPSVDEPAEVPDDPLCGVCNMVPAEHPHSNAQVVHEDEARQFFCTPGCLLSYSVVPEDVAETTAPIENAWARDANSESLELADELYWVLDTNPDRGIDPMRNPLPYEEYDDAVSWVEEYDDLSENDIVTLDEVTREDVGQYREFYLE